MDMSVNIAGIEWKNPVTVASGTFGSGAEFADYVDINKLGAVTTKGVANVPWAGNPTRLCATDGFSAITSLYLIIFSLPFFPHRRVQFFLYAVFLIQ